MPAVPHGRMHEAPDITARTRTRNLWPIITRWSFGLQGPVTLSFDARLTRGGPNRRDALDMDMTVPWDRAFSSEMDVSRVQGHSEPGTRKIRVLTLSSVLIIAALAGVASERRDASNATSEEAS